MTQKVIAVTRPAPVASNLQADTRLELYRATINSAGVITGISLIASDNNSSPYGTGFSRIEEDNLTAGTYYVRVVNLPPDGNTSALHYVIGLFLERENWGSYPSGTGGTGGSGDPDGGTEIGNTTPTAGGDIDGDGTVDYLCDGAALSIIGLDNDPNWSVSWSSNNPAVTFSGNVLQAGGFSGEVVITAMIYYDGVLAGNAVETFWVGSPAAPTLDVTGLNQSNTFCETLPIYFSTAGATQGFATHYVWKAYRNGFILAHEETTTNPFVTVNILANSLPVGTYFASVSACNDCGCTESSLVDLTILPLSDPDCQYIDQGKGKIQIKPIQKEVLIFPNPATNELNVQLPSSYEETTYIELINSIGQVVVSQSYTKNKIKLSLKGLPKGLYSLKIQNKESLKVEKIIVE